MPSYFACRWEHDDPVEPVVLYEELNGDRIETRKVHKFRDGSTERTDRVRDGARTSLSWGPVPPLDEIEQQPEFTLLPLSPEQFEEVWASASDAR